MIRKIQTQIRTSIGAILVVGCTRSPSPLPPVKEDTAATGSTNDASVAPRVEEPESGTDAGTSVDAAPSSTPLPTGAACANDDECGWDDPCSPKACGAKVEVPKGKNCGRPKTPGACRCVEKTCTLVKSEAVREAEHVACKQSSECAFDPKAGSCVSAVSSSAPESGVACLCDPLNFWCVQIWQGEVACKSPKDCSWQHLNGGGTNAAPAWFAPRPKPVPVRPCKDGEHDSVCTDGKCVIRAWKC